MIIAALPGLAEGSELCSMMGGTCQDVCRSDQYAESGVFEDCGEKQECCVRTTAAPAAGKGSDAHGGTKETVPAERGEPRTP
jgi:hypothetical protein